jgi:hypothetical protein
MTATELKLKYYYNPECLQPHGVGYDTPIGNRVLFSELQHFLFFYREIAEKIVNLWNGGDLVNPNKTEHDAESYECAMMYLDKLGITRKGNEGRDLSIVGRIIAFGDWIAEKVRNEEKLRSPMDILNEIEKAFDMMNPDPAIETQGKKLEEIRRERPPLGVMPKKMWDEQRINNLTDAIKRANDAGKYDLKVSEWVHELSLLYWDRVNK